MAPSGAAAAARSGTRSGARGSASSRPGRNSSRKSIDKTKPGRTSSAGNHVCFNEEKQRPSLHPGECREADVGSHRDSGVTLTSIESTFSMRTVFTSPGGPEERQEGSPIRRLMTNSVDMEQLKMHVRKNISDATNEYDVTDLYRQEGLWQKVARSSYFENFTLLVISVNALWMAYDTDENGASTLLEAEPRFQVMEHLFCVYFSAEWFIRFMSFAQVRTTVKDFWFVFDSVLVFMMVGETWVMTFVMYQVTGGGASGGLGNASILRLFRLLRLTRLARMLRSMQELMILIKGMLAAMRSVGSVMCLLFGIVYVFSIAFVTLSKEYDFGPKLFNSIPEATINLIIRGVLVDSLADTCTTIASESTVCLILFFFFILLGALTMMNMLIGVLCEVVSNVAATEREAMSVDFVTRKIQCVLNDIDQDDDCQISKREFLSIIANQEACAVLQEVGVDPIGLVDMIDFIFPNSDDGDKARTSLDSLEGGATLSFDEFMDMIWSFRSSNMVTVRDMVDLRKACMKKLLSLEQTLIPFLEQQAQFPTHRVRTGTSARRSRSPARSTEFGNSPLTRGPSPTRMSGAAGGRARERPRSPHAERTDESLSVELRKLQGSAAYVEGLLSTALREVQALVARQDAHEAQQAGGPPARRGPELPV